MTDPQLYTIIALVAYALVMTLIGVDEQKAIIEHLDKQVDFIDSLIIEKQNLITELELYKRSLIFERIA